MLERAAFVCCDSREQSQLESGDLIEPVEQGVLDWLEVHELQEVVTGELRGRAPPEDIVVFKSNGIAAWDLAAGARVVELARERGVGTRALDSARPPLPAARCCGDDVVAEGVEDVRPVEQPRRPARARAGS